MHDIVGHLVDANILNRDRATYDASSSQQVTYTVANAGDAPSTLTFGPSFMSLAGTYDGKVTIGFNRRLNNLANTVAAAAKAVDQIGSLHAIELGNEPNCRFRLAPGIYSPLTICQSSAAVTLSPKALPGQLQRTATAK
jgi:hypothetical protein